MTTETAAIAHQTAEQLQTWDIALLAAAAAGEVDLQALARRVLASRGLDGSGQWVGFKRAREALAA